MNEDWLRMERRERELYKKLRAYAIATGLFLSAVLLSVAMGWIR